MILLLGGTSETRRLATALAEAGLDVLVSTSTDIALSVGEHPRIRRRIGALDHESMAEVALELGVKAIVDATHPYAASARFTARRVAAKLGLPYFRWRRPESLGACDSVHFADDHEHAAEIACSFKCPVLVTTGSKHLLPYTEKSREAGVDVIARVLSRPESVKAAKEAGLSEEKIATGRGPFSVQENISIIDRFKVGVIVTKDSGEAGGVPAKIEAARRRGCRVVVVRRPEDPSAAQFDDLSALVHAVSALVYSGSQK